MAEALTLARPYARAAFEVARGQGALADWARRLALAAELAVDPRVAGFLGDPRVTTGQRAELVLPEGEAADSPFTAFVRLLAENDRLPLLPEIGALYEALRQESEQVLHVNVRAAAPLDAAAGDRLRDALKRRFGREIEMTATIDPSVIGGAVIDAGDIVIDGSVRGQLARLGEALAH